MTPWTRLLVNEAWNNFGIRTVGTYSLKFQQKKEGTLACDGNDTSISVKCGNALVFTAFKGEIGVAR